MRYKIVSGMTAYNRQSGQTREFMKGEIVEGNLQRNEFGDVEGVNVAGYVLPVSYLEPVKDYTKPIVLALAIGFIIFMALLFKSVSKN
jgi:hypothetical protein